MDIETKTVRGNPDLYVPFGWEHIEDKSVRGTRGHHRTEHVLARNKDIPNRDKLIILEEQYFQLRSKEKYYSTMEFGDVVICACLFLLFIFPGILYLVIRNARKSSVQAFNDDLHKKMNKVVEEAKSLL